MILVRVGTSSEISIVVFWLIFREVVISLTETLLNTNGSCFAPIVIILLIFFRRKFSFEILAKVTQKWIACITGAERLEFFKIVVRITLSILSIDCARESTLIINGLEGVS